MPHQKISKKVKLTTQSRGKVVKRKLSKKKLSKRKAKAQVQFKKQQRRVRARLVKKRARQRRNVRMRLQGDHPSAKKFMRRRRRGNNFRLKRPPQKIRRRSRQRAYKPKPLVLTSPNDMYRHRRGLSLARPEILFQMNYIPGYYSDGETKKESIHTIIEAQKSLRNLFVENNGQILDRLKANPDLEDEIEEILENYDATITGAKEVIKQLGHISDFVKGSKHYLDFKARGPQVVQEYNDKQEARRESKTENLTTQIDELKVKAEAARASGGNVAYYMNKIRVKQRSIKSLKADKVDDVHEILTDTGYRKSAFNNFSNTKIIGQVLTDLKSTMTHHSPCLIDRNARLRKRDKHPFNIDDAIRSKSGDKSGFSIDEYNDYKSAVEVHKRAIKDLPTIDSDRQAVLINDLVRLSRMSISLAAPRVQGFLENNFPAIATDRSMWDEVYGEPNKAFSGRTVPVGASTVIRIPSADGMDILPLENTYIRSRNGKHIYQPGSVALSDYILDSGLCDASRYGEYARHYMETIEKTAKATMMMYFVGRTAVGAMNRTSFSRSRRGNGLGSRAFDFQGDTLFRRFCDYAQTATSGHSLQIGNHIMVANDQGKMGFLFDLCDKDDFFRFLTIRLILLVKRKRELEQNEDLIAYLEQDEELSAQLEREELLTKLQSPTQLTDVGAKFADAGSPNDLKRLAVTMNISDIVSSSECEKIIILLIQRMQKRIRKRFGRPSRSGSRRGPTRHGARRRRGIRNRRRLGRRGRTNRATAKGRARKNRNSVPVGTQWGPTINMNTQQLADDMRNPETGIYGFIYNLARSYDRYLMSAKRRVSPEGVRDAAALGTEMDDELAEANSSVRSAAANMREAKSNQAKMEAKAQKAEANAEMFDRIAEHPFYDLNRQLEARGATLPGGVLAPPSPFDIMFSSLADSEQQKANALRTFGQLGVNVAQTRVDNATENRDFVARARAALKRRAMDAVPDIFDIDEAAGERFSRYGSVPEEHFMYMFFDSLVTTLGEVYEIRITARSNTRMAVVNARGRQGYRQVPFFKFKVNVTAQTAASNAILDLKGKDTVPDDYQDSLEDAEAVYWERATDFFKGTEDALEEERIFVAKRLRVLNMFGTSLVKHAIRVNAFFDLAVRPDRPWKKAISAVLRMPGGNTILAGLNDSQMRLKHYMVESLSSNTKELKRIPVPHYDRLKNGQAVLLTEFMKEWRYRATRADNLNVLAVGLPIGMIKDLETGIIDNKSKSSVFDPYKRNSLLRLKVWKRDAQFDDLVFKPRVYVFDHTRFLSPVDSFTDVKVGDTFRDIIGNKLRFIDYDEEGRLQPEGQEYKDVKYSDDLKLIRAKDRYFVIRNTLYSEALKLYIRLLTGINLDEQEFFLDKRMAATREKVRQDRKTRKIISEILQIYLNDEGVETETQYKEHQAMIDQITSFTQTTLFKAKENSLAALHPTAFDRIFCIGVDPDTFEIDRRKTMSTRSGRNALRSAIRMKQVIRRRGKYYLRPRRKTEGKVAIYEYFVTADMILGNKSIHKKRLQAERREAAADSKASPWAKFMDHENMSWKGSAMASLAPGDSPPWWAAKIK